MARKILKLLTVCSAVILGISLFLFPLSLFARFPELEDHGVIDHWSFPIGGQFRCIPFGGSLWIFSGEYPYQGSIIALRDENHVSWAGKWTTEISDWEWVLGSNGISQDSFVGEDGISAGKARYGDLPGVYYRHFEWWNSDDPWTTLSVSLLYPIVLSAILPMFWIYRKIRASRRAKNQLATDQHG